MPMPMMSIAQYQATALYLGNSQISISSGIGCYHVISGSASYYFFFAGDTIARVIVDGFCYTVSSAIKEAK